MERTIEAVMNNNMKHPSSNTDAVVPSLASTYHSPESSRDVFTGIPNHASPATLSTTASPIPSISKESPNSSSGMEADGMNHYMTDPQFLPHRPHATRPVTPQPQPHTQPPTKAPVTRSRARRPTGNVPLPSPLDSLIAATKAKLLSDVDKNSYTSSPTGDAVSLETASKQAVEAARGLSELLSEEYEVKVALRAKEAKIELGDYEDEVDKEGKKKRGRKPGAAEGPPTVDNRRSKTRDGDQRRRDFLERNRQGIWW